MSKDKEEKNGRERENHQGSTAAQDIELSRWLWRLWAKNEAPERIEVFQAFGLNGQTRGELIHHEDFKPNEKIDQEQVNKLANEIMAVVQYDCDSREKKSSYQLSIVDRNRKAMPLVRRIGPLQPQRSYVVSSDVDDEDDEKRDPQALQFDYNKEAMSQIRWDKTRNDKILGEMFMLLSGIITDLRQENSTLRSQNTLLHEKYQDSEDRTAQRTILIDEKKFNLRIKENMLLTAQNLLPGFFGPNSSSTASATSNGKTENGSTTGETKDYGPSAERMQVTNFINNCAAANIDIALFGDFEEIDGKHIQTKPGIFSFQQFRIMMGVRDGRLPPSAIDVLLPDSGHELAVTQEQIGLAIKAGVTTGIGISLQELMNLRRAARDATRAATAVANEATVIENPIS